MFSEVAEIALVAARLGQFQQLLKTRVILILNFTRPHAITYTKGEFLKGSFKYNGAMIWNQLLNEAKLSDSLNSFKNKLITCLGYAMLHSFSLVPQYRITIE